MKGICSSKPEGHCSPIRSKTFFCAPTNDISDFVPGITYGGLDLLENDLRNLSRELIISKQPKVFFKR